MPDVTVSANVDTMLRAANNAAIRSAIGVGQTDAPTFLGLALTGTTSQLLKMNAGNWFGTDGSQVFLYNSGYGAAVVSLNNGSSGLAMRSDWALGWTNSGTAAGTMDINLFRDAPGILAQRNGTNAQAFRVYDTYDTAGTNYERGTFGFPIGTNTLRIGTEQAGTGVAQPIDFVVGGTRRGGFLTNGKFEASIASNQAYIGTILNVTDTKYFWDFSNTLEVALFARLQTSPIMQFAGTDANFPALKRSSARLQAVLANDSGFTNIQGKLTTDTAYTATTVVATGYITLYDSTGTAYRVPCAV